MYRFFSPVSCNAVIHLTLDTICNNITVDCLSVCQSSQWFERRIVGVCERMMRGGRWAGGGEGEKLHHSVRHRGMTLLHLAAAQGYTHLIHTLIHWRYTHKHTHIHNNMCGHTRFTVDVCVL